MTAPAVGLDVGSTFTKAAMLDGGKVIAASIVPTGHNLLKAVGEATRLLGDVNGFPIAVTGYGRHLVSKNFNAQNLTEIRAHALGASLVSQGVELIVDIGGQDTKVIRIGSGGAVIDFVLNDRCAAGTGRYLEMLKNTLEYKFDEFDKAASSDVKAAALTSTCAVFAQSEVSGLMAVGVAREAIAKGSVIAIAGRLASDMLRVSGGKISRTLACGGGAEVKALLNFIEQETGFEILTAPYGRHIGAIGAAVVAASS